MKAIGCLQQGELLTHFASNILEVFLDLARDEITIG